MREAVRIHDLPLNIYAAADGQEAIEFIAKAEEDDTTPCPHLLLPDLNLPKVEGFEVLRRLRESRRLSEIPVLIVSSSDSPEDRGAAAALGGGILPQVHQLRRVSDARRGVEKTTGGEWAGLSGESRGRLE